jgi:hypothetical protein
MTTAAVVLRGRRGWVAVTSLALVLAGIVGVQVRPTVAHADLTPVASTTSLSPSVAASASAVEPVVTPEADIPVSSAGPASPAAAPATAPATAPAHKAPRAPKTAAPATDVCSGTGWQQKRGQHALSTLKDTGQRSGVTVSFKAAKSGFLGLTYPTRRHVDVFVRSCSSESSALLRHVVSHEMGHAYDEAHMTAAMRESYKAMRGIPASTPWFGCSYCTDFNTPAGDFAETYSQWQRSSADSRTQIAPMPGPAQLAKIAATFFQG